MRSALVAALALIALLAWALTREEGGRAPRAVMGPKQPPLPSRSPEPQREFRPTGSAFAELPGRLKIEVVNEKREALPGIDITIKGRGAASRLRTDRDGWAYFSPDEPGRFEIHIHPPLPYPPYLAEVRHIGARQRFVRYMLRRGREVTIHVEVDGVAGLPGKFTLDAGLSSSPAPTATV